MSKKGFIRELTVKPGVPEDALVLDDPAEIPKPVPQRPPMWVWIGLFVVAAIVLMVMLYKSGARQLSTGSFFIFPVMMVSMVMMMRGRMGGADKKSHGAAKNQERADYLRGLDELRVMMADRRLANPEKFAHVRQELGIDG